ncbi:putative ion channel regulatory protein UNC-93 [Lyophyllum shimeji]|uniref:Ion channel regulatory protein UNC-93 n=1 Tax=Lyophyllum shimeji TaxID=47721 RepID=A0A9P3URU4_LYOSH|nr:putative ion channel regulatory protein UNC-93 [Lyophyllum shimeji]
MSGELKLVDQVQIDNMAPVTRSFYRSTLFQMLVVGFIAFLGPGLWNATNSLGAGGALEPYLVNAANSIVFAVLGLLCIISAIAVNKIGVKWTLVLGSLAWAPYSSALYQNNRYGTQWYVIFASAVCGISAGLYWAAEGAIVLAYPEHRKRGRYLAIWQAFKSSGQIVGGAINLGVNIHRSTGGKISYATLLAFVVLQVLAFPASFLISNPEQVQREDGTRVKVEQRTSTLEQVRILWKTLRSRQMGFLLPLSFSSWFYWGYASTFLTLYFSVRARALASFLSAITGITASTLLGCFLDSQRFSLKTRGRYGGVLVMAVFSGILIWALVVQHAYSAKNPGKLDWSSPGFGRGFGLYIMLNTAGPMVQNYLYWAVGSLGDGTSELTRNAGIFRGVEAWGQCASFGVGSSRFSPFYTVVINVVFWVVSIPPAWFSLVTIGDANSPYVDHSQNSSATATTPDTVSEKR